MADSDRKDQTTQQPESPEFVIPDGGLSTSMPAWLLQRPNWAGENATVATERSVSDPVATTGPEPAAAETAAPRELPPPDTSHIQLADVLTVDDLPAWLRAVAERAEREREPDQPEAAHAATTDAASVDEPVVVTDTLAVPDAVSVAARVDNSGRSQMIIGGVITAVALVLLYLILSLTNVI